MPLLIPLQDGSDTLTSFASTPNASESATCNPCFILMNKQRSPLGHLLLECFFQYSKRGVKHTFTPEKLAAVVQQTQMPNCLYPTAFIKIIISKLVPHFPPSDFFFFSFDKNRHQPPNSWPIFKHSKLLTANNLFYIFRINHQNNLLKKTD